MDSRRQSTSKDQIVFPPLFEPVVYTRGLKFNWSFEFSNLGTFGVELSEIQEANTYTYIEA
jgi:hypothetical protein